MCLEGPSLPDPATVSVIRHHLEAVARQVGVAMQQSAISQLLNQAYDFSTAIFDAQGRVLRSLPAAGFVVWDGRDDRSMAVAAGVYWARVMSEGRILNSTRILRVD